MAAGGTSVAPYLITACATLSGVAITAAFAEYRERRRSREERQRERDRVTEERWKWLRQERRQAYAALVHLGFQAAATLIEAASRLHDQRDPDRALELWPRLDELGDAVAAQVADVRLVGSAAVIEAAHGLRRAVRRAPNALERRVAAYQAGETDSEELSARVRAVYRATDSLVEAATADLHVSPDVDDEAERTPAPPQLPAPGERAEGDET
jgi:hypothetical protein